MIITMTIGDTIDLSVTRMISDGDDHVCEDDHDVPAGTIYFIDDADVILCEDHFYESIKGMIDFEAKIVS